MVKMPEEEKKEVPRYRQIGEKAILIVLLLFLLYVMASPLLDSMARSSQKKEDGRQLAEQAAIVAAEAEKKQIMLLEEGSFEGSRSQKIDNDCHLRNYENVSWALCERRRKQREEQMKLKTAP